MKKTIELSSSYNKSNWISFIQRNRLNDSNVSSLCIDLGDCAFLEPFHLVSLACLIEEYYINGVKIEFQLRENYGLNEYLSKLKFFNYWSTEIDRAQFRPAEIQTNLNIWKISDQMIDTYSNVSQKYFEDNFNSTHDFAPFSICLKELFNNINDHSQSGVSGFCISQYYPSQNKIKFAVCDLGMGIPTSVNNFLSLKGQDNIDDPSAIILAFEQAFSVQSIPQNRGAGLDILKNISISNNGEILLISNSGYYKLKIENINSSKLKYRFGGTVIEVVLDTLSFHLKEDDQDGIDIDF
jgi:hypothetical protein